MATSAEQSKMDQSKQKSDVSNREQQSMARPGERRGYITPWQSSSLSLGPFGFMRRMMDEMDRMFEDLGFGDDVAAQSQQRGTPPTTWAPRIDVSQREGQLVVRADLPGVRPEDVDLEIDEGMLRISGERREERQEGEGRSRRTEVFYGSFVRTVPLPEGADPDKVKANFANGVLEITVPAPQQHRGRRIEIQSGQPGAGNVTTH